MVEQEVERRSVLGRIASLPGVLVLFLFGAPGLATLLGAGRRSGEESWQDVEDAAVVEKDAPLRFSYRIRAGWEVRRSPGYLVRKKDDEIVAFRARCTHLGCTVGARDQTFRCPCHGGVFSLDGEPLEGPVRKPLERLDCRIRQGRVEVRV